MPAQKPPACGHLSSRLFVVGVQPSIIDYQRIESVVNIQFYRWLATDDVNRRQATWTLFEIEGHTVAIIQVADALALNRGVAHIRLLTRFHYDDAKTACPVIFTNDAHMTLR